MLGMQYETQLVPCGKCVSCKLDYSREWATRVFHEMSVNPTGMFLTLTINDESMVREGFYRKGEYYPPYSVYKRSLQLFLKRMRKALSIVAVNPETGRKKRFYQKFRYLGCGEYGNAKLRPHYHVAVMGIEFPDKRYWKHSRSGEMLFRSETLETLWPYGYSSIGEVTWQSAAYVARYTVKKSADKKEYEKTDVETGEVIDLLPEFLIMSKGIGLDWWKRYGQDTDKDYLIVDFTKRVKVPRYYDKQREKKDPDSLEAIKQQREIRAKEKQKDDTPERRMARDIVKRTQNDMLERGLDYEEEHV